MPLWCAACIRESVPFFCFSQPLTAPGSRVPFCTLHLAVPCQLLSSQVQHKSRERGMYLHTHLGVQPRLVGGVCASMQEVTLKTKKLTWLGLPKKKRPPATVWILPDSFSLEQAGGYLFLYLHPLLPAPFCYSFVWACSACDSPSRTQPTSQEWQPDKRLTALHLENRWRGTQPRRFA